MLYISLFFQMSFVHTDKMLSSKANENKICRANQTHEVGHVGHEFQTDMFLPWAPWKHDGAYQLGWHHIHSNFACTHVLTNMWQFFLKLYSNQFWIFYIWIPSIQSHTIWKSWPALHMDFKICSWNKIWLEGCNYSWQTIPFIPWCLF